MHIELIEGDDEDSYWLIIIKMHELYTAVVSQTEYGIIESFNEKL